MIRQDKKSNVGHGMHTLHTHHTYSLSHYFSPPSPSSLQPCKILPTLLIYREENASKACTVNIPIVLFGNKRFIACCCPQML